jgi:leader peptidase (prepilin peptidase)/N-methyltransferase
VPLAAAVVAAAVAGLVLGGPLHAAARRLARGNPVFPGSAGWDGARGRAATRLVSAALPAATVLVHHDDPAQLVLGLLLVAVLVPLTLVDVAVRLLPDRLMGPAALAAILAGTLLDPGGEPARLAAGVLAGGMFLLPAIVRPGDLGMGDVKLSTVIGLFLGGTVAVAVVVALVAGVVAGVALMARKGVRAGRRTAVAFGPFLALGAVVALLAGDGLLDAYLTTF